MKKFWLAALTAGLAAAALLAAQAPSDTFRFVIIGDRTGETQPGIFERVLKEAAAEKPAFAVTVGDTIQGLKDATAEAEWRDAQRLFAPYKQLSFYLVPGNHDVWSDASEKLYPRYSGHPLHYGFDYGTAHFTMLDNSRSDELSADQLVFLEADLKAHADQPLKFIVSHRPSWIFNAMLGDKTFPLHLLAKKYGVQYVIAGHVHEMLRIELDGVNYLSMPSAGGHLRASGKYEDGWFFGFTTVDIRKNEANFAIHDLDGPTTKLTDWSTAGLAVR